MQRDESCCDVESLSPGLTSSEGTDERDEYSLGGAMETHLKEVSLNRSEEVQRHIIRTYVSAVVEHHWPQALVKFYGSFSYGLSTTDSPVDIVVEGCSNLDTTFHSLLSPLGNYITVKRIMNDSCEAMLRGRCRASGLVVNISFFESKDMSPARYAAIAARQWLRQFPAARSVVAVVRTLLQMEGGIPFSTYHLLLLTVAMCNSSASRDAGVLLVEFLDYYGQRFAFDKEAIVDGAAVSRIKLGDVVSPSPVIVVDPVSGINVTQTLTSLHCVRFRRTLRKRLHRLNDWVLCRSLCDNVFDAVVSEPNSPDLLP